MKSEDDDFSDGEFNISDEYTKKEEVKMVKNKSVKPGIPKRI